MGGRTKRRARKTRTVLPPLRHRVQGAPRRSSERPAQRKRRLRPIATAWSLCQQRLHDLRKLAPPTARPERVLLSSDHEHSPRRDHRTCTGAHWLPPWRAPCGCRRSRAQARSVDAETALTVVTETTRRAATGPASGRRAAARRAARSISSFGCRRAGVRPTASAAVGERCGKAECVYLSGEATRAGE